MKDMEEISQVKWARGKVGKRRGNEPYYIIKAYKKIQHKIGGKYVKKLVKVALEVPFVLFCFETGSHSVARLECSGT